jgi:uncharacterized repeat protein (TIGR01451 family)
MRTSRLSRRVPTLVLCTGLTGAVLLAPAIPARAQFFRAAPRGLHASPYITGGEVALADFNGDGKLDGVRALVESGYVGIAVQLGDGAGNFGGPQLTKLFTSSISNSRAVVAVDLNGDGKVDVVTSHVATGVYAYINQGNGVFVGTVLGGGSVFLPAEGMAVGDFDGDGKLDIAVARKDNFVQVVLFKGQGNGLFDPPVYLTLPATVFYPREMAAADFNRDGKMDLALADDAANKVVVLLGEANLAMTVRGPYPTGLGAWGVRTGDLNGDQNPDVVVANRGAGTISILLGNGAGDLGPATTLTGLRLAQKLALADFNGDGRLDVAAAGAGLWVYPGNGAGGLGAPRRFGVRGDLAAGDLTGDGKPDLIVGPSVVLNDGTGDFLAQRAFLAGRQPEGIVSGDWNHDGKLDLAAANPPGSVVSILLGDGAGGFGAPTSVVTFSDPYALTAGDFNADGHSDLAVVTRTSSEVVVLVGDGAGGFSPGPRYFVCATPSGITHGDWNGDGRVDLAVSCVNSDSISLLLGTGGGTFVPGTPPVVGLGARGLAAARLNADVRDDLAVIRDEFPLVPEPHSDLKLLAGAGNGSFVPAGTLPVAPGPKAVLVADLDQDGLPDTATGADAGQQFPEPEGGLGLLFANGTGSFDALPMFGPEGIRSLASADFTRDGRPDLALGFGSIGTAAADGALSVVMGAPDRTFGTGMSVDVGGRPSSMLSGDFNGDGFPDVVVANASGDSVTVFLNQPAPAGADLEVAILESADPAITGQAVRYTVTVTNHGPLPATGVQLTFRIPAGLTFVAIDPTPACIDGGVPGGGNATRVTTCAVGPLAPGASFVLHEDTTVYQSGAFVTTEAVVGRLSPTDANPLNDKVVEQTRISPVDLVVALSAAPEPVAPGGALHVTVHIENKGPATATWVYTRLPLVPGLVPVSATYGCGVFGDGVTCFSLELAPGASQSGVIDYVAGSFVVATTTASATSDQTGFLGFYDLNPADNVASVETHLTPLVARELTHGTNVTKPIPIPAAEDRYLVRMGAQSSYEVLVDAASGDLAPPGGALALERLGQDGSSVAQTSRPVGTGPGRSLRWERSAATPIVESVRVRSTGCGTDCGADDTFRVRAYETTASIPRFNTEGTQTTVVVLFNPRDEAVTGHLWLWSKAGAPLGSQAFNIGPRRTLIADLSLLMPGTQGSITITHDAPYGGLVGKSVALEPSTGFSFDSSLAWKGR